MDEKKNKQSSHKWLRGHKEDISKTSLSFRVSIHWWATADEPQEDFFCIL